MRNYFQYDEEDEDEDVVVVTVDSLGDEDGFMSVDFAPEEQQMRGEETIDLQAYDVHSFHVENGGNENKSSMRRSLTTIHAGRHSEGEWTNVSDQFDCDSGVGMIAI